MPRDKANAVWWTENLAKGLPRDHFGVLGCPFHYIRLSKFVFPCHQLSLSTHLSKAGHLLLSHSSLYTHRQRYIRFRHVCFDAGLVLWLSEVNDIRRDWP